MMFDKDAEEIAYKRLCSETMCFPRCNYSSPKHHRCGEWHRCYETAKEGIELGYAKANEWHDLRKDPKDYPEKEKLGQTFIVAFAFNEQTQKYYSFDCAEYIDKGRFITHTINGANENNGYKVIAWKEIVLPKKVEE